jgi:hypothetical protein
MSGKLVHHSAVPVMPAMLRTTLDSLCPGGRVFFFCSPRKMLAVFAFSGRRWNQGVGPGRQGADLKNTISKPFLAQRPRGRGSYQS